MNTGTKLLLLLLAVLTAGCSVTEPERSDPRLPVASSHYNLNLEPSKLSPDSDLAKRIRALEESCSFMSLRNDPKGTDLRLIAIGEPDVFERKLYKLLKKGAKTERALRAANDGHPMGEFLKDWVLQGKLQAKKERYSLTSRGRAYLTRQGLYFKANAKRTQWTCRANDLLVTLKVGKRFGEGEFVARLGSNAACRGVYQVHADW